MNKPIFVLRTWYDTAERFVEVRWWRGDTSDVISACLADELNFHVTARAVRAKVREKKFLRDPSLPPTVRGAREHEKLTAEPEPMLRDGKPITLANCKDKDCRWITGLPVYEVPICGHPIKARSLCIAHLDRAYPGWNDGLM